MSAANFGTLPSRVIVKSFAPQVLADATNVDLFSIVIPALTAYTYRGNTPIRLIANGGQELIGAGVVTAFPAGAIPVTSYLYSANTLGNGVNVANPSTAAFALNGFVYNVTSTDVTIKFVINANVNGGDSNIQDAVIVYFTPVSVSGFSV